MKDSAIIDLFQSDSARAIIELDTKYGRRFMRFALRVLNSDSDARECVRLSYEYAASCINKDCPISLKAYIYRIIRNIASLHFTGSTALIENSRWDAALRELTEHLKEYAPGNIQLSAAESAPGTLHADSGPLTRVIETFFVSLSAEDRVIFMRRYWFADSHSDIAERSLKKVGAVSRRLDFLGRAFASYLSKSGLSLPTYRSLAAALRDIDLKYIAEADNYKFRQKNYFKFAKILSSACACLVLIVLAAVVYVYTENMHIYSDALSYFNEYNLNTSIMSPSDMQEVYEDLISKSFSSQKTLDVLAASIPDSYTFILSRDIYGQDNMQDIMLSMWDVIVKRKDIGKQEYAAIEYSSCSGGNNTNFEKYSFSAEGKRECMWSVCFEKQRVHEYFTIGDVIFLYGDNTADSYASDLVIWYAFIDNKTGEFLLKEAPNNQNGIDAYNFMNYVSIDESVEAVHILLPGKLYTKAPVIKEYSISEDEHKKIIINTINVENDYLNYTLDYSVKDFMPFFDDYLIKLEALENNTGNKENTDSRILRCRSDGIVEQFLYFNYDGGQEYYVVNDVAEYDGSIYISTYSLPYDEDIWYSAIDIINEVYTDRLYNYTVKNTDDYEIFIYEPEIETKGKIGIIPFTYVNYQYYEYYKRALLLDGINELINPDNNVATEYIQNMYTAALFVCGSDPEDFKILCSADSSVGREMYIRNGMLIWNVSTVTKAVYSLGTSSYSWIVDMDLYEYSITGQSLVDTVNTHKNYTMHM